MLIPISSFLQVSDIRRARQRHAIEMTVMARRPFASQDVVIRDDDPSSSFLPSHASGGGSASPPDVSRRRAKNRLSSMCSVHQHNAVRDAVPTTKRLLEPEQKFQVIYCNIL